MWQMPLGLLMLVGAFGLAPTSPCGNDDLRDQIKRLKGRLTAEMEDGKILLRSLDFYFCKWNKKELQQLAEILRSAAGLKVLRLDRSTVDSDLLDTMGRLRSLEALSLAFCDLNDDGSKRLQHLENLTILDLRKSGITSLNSFRRNANLLELDVSFNNMGDDGIAAIGSFKRLQKFAASGLPLTDRSLEELVRVEGIQYLNLRFTETTDAGISKLTRLAKLQFLDVSGTDISNGTFEALSNLTHLKTLKVGFTSVSEAAIERVRKARPELEVIDY